MPISEKPPFGGFTATVRKALPNLSRGCKTTEIVVLFTRENELNLLGIPSRDLRLLCVRKLSVLNAPLLLK